MTSVPTRDDDRLNAHGLVAAFVPDGSRVLDIGCGFGQIASRLRQRGCRITGVEPDPVRREAAAQFCERVMDGVAEGLDQLDLKPASFDAILFADVLEHLVNPWAALRDVQRFLKPDGLTVISIPNVANFGVRANLLKGQFEYQDFGIYDRTHLRFFTRSSADDLVKSAGLRVVQRGYTSNLTETGLYRRTLGRMRSLRHSAQRFDSWLTYRKPELFAVQFILACQRASGGESPSGR
jgi:SAM-dependent methyltransferase